MQEIEEIRSLAREFAQAELRPGIEGWDRERALGERTLAQVGELGFFGMLVGDEYGGMGFELPAYVAALEQLAWGEPAVALTVAQNALAATILQRFGKDEVRSTWLEGIARGDAIAC